MSSQATKLLGQFYTPQDVARFLVRCVVRSSTDRLLDPACGDGQFLRLHRNIVGVDVSGSSCAAARASAPWAAVHEGDFFAWAEQARERFDAVVGNPPFIRYQLFSGAARERALRLARRAGARLSALASSWAPFVAASATLLKPGGRMGFVVPAELGHAPYAVPLLEALCEAFERVHVIALREKIFPELAEDAWLLLACGKGGRTTRIEFTPCESFAPFAAPPPGKEVSLARWRAHGSRLRRFLCPEAVLDYYASLAAQDGCVRLSELATVGIGYVSGANDFFHLRPSQARLFGIPDEFLRPSVRKGDQLPEGPVTPAVVRRWLAQDLPVLLLDLSRCRELPDSVKRYLDTSAGAAARATYKCRNRVPWYVVPDVVVPDAFVSYMCGDRPRLARNLAGCVCSNSVHAVRFCNGAPPRHIQTAWNHPICDLSKELEGHPLGGGMLKLEPREAARVLIPLSLKLRNEADLDLLYVGINTARAWRHYGNVSARVPATHPAASGVQRGHLDSRPGPHPAHACSCGDAAGDRGRFPP